VHGLVPYRDFAVAQPPPVLLVGAALLELGDGLGTLQLGLSVLGVVTAMLVGYCVWRLYRRLWLAALAALATPLLPLSLQSHAQLVPESLAAPLILAGAVLLGERSDSYLGGALLGVAAWCKLAFLAPALAIALAVPARRRAGLVVLVSFVLLCGLSIAVFGGAVWRQAVTAQLQVGTASLRYVGGLLAQAAWN